MNSAEELRNTNFKEVIKTMGRPFDANFEDWTTSEPYDNFNSVYVTICTGTLLLC